MVKESLPGGWSLIALQCALALGSSRLIVSTEFCFLRVSCMAMVTPRDPDLHVAFCCPFHSYGRACIGGGMVQRAVCLL